MLALLVVAWPASAVVVLLCELLVAEANRTKPNTFDQEVVHNVTLLTVVLVLGLSCRDIATRTIFEAMFRNMRPGGIHASNDPKDNARSLEPQSKVQYTKAPRSSGSSQMFLTTKTCCLTKVEK
jgi:hypothetical protein